MQEEPTPAEQEIMSQTTPTNEPHHHSESRLNRFRNWYLDRKKWTIPLSILLFLLILAGVPFTRYALAGTVYKKDFTIRVTDSTTHTPVSGATVSSGAVSAETNSDGVAKLHLKVGPHEFDINKKYYQEKIVNLTIPLFSQKSQAFELTAIGRQAKITVTNILDKTPLENVNIKAAGITAKTDKQGIATVVLPADAAEQKAKLSLSGYNDSDVTVKVSGDKIQENAFTLTPAGKVYFLSKLSGKIDVVKTNLDGTDRETVLAGTGKEDQRNTVLLASRDWKYLALYSRRAGNSPTLYAIDTSNDNLATVESGTNGITIHGWVGNDFVYTVTKSNLKLWQPNRDVLKAFNAPTKRSTTLDQTTASGTNEDNYIAETIGSVYVYNGQVYYIKNWESGYDNPSPSFTSKQATFNAIKPDGSSKRAIKSFSLVSGADSYYITLDERIESPDKVVLSFYDGDKNVYYVYSDGQVTKDSDETDESFYDSDYPTYLQSPSGDKTFWSESRDGKNTLFIGDEDGNGGKQIATLSDYDTYGWFTDNYLLVSKNSSELYIMPNTGSKNPVKISDYHKPSRNFYGYGGGYGGL